MHACYIKVAQSQLHRSIGVATRVKFERFGYRVSFNTSAEHYTEYRVKTVGGLAVSVG